MRAFSIPGVDLRANGGHMQKLIAIAWVTAVAACGAAHAQAVFNGTWRPDPQRPEPGRKPEAYQLRDGSYTCSSCEPPYTIKANGSDQPVQNPHANTISVTIIDDRTIRKVGKKAGHTVVDTTMKVAADDKTMTTHELLSGLGSQPVDLTSQLSRAAAGPVGSHHVSGSWNLIESDLTNHDEDTTYKLSGDVLSMTDRMGRSFTAKLDGTDAPYKGSPDFTTVSVKLINPHTLEEVDKNAGQAIVTTRWTVDPDGRTMHAHFNMQGRVMEQTGHKVP